MEAVKHDSRRRTYDGGLCCEGRNPEARLRELRSGEFGKEELVLGRLSRDLYNLDRFGQGGEHDSCRSVNLISICSCFCFAWST